MRDHEECERMYQDALAANKPGKAEWVLTYCDIRHGRLKATAPTERVAPVRAELAAARTDTEESQP